MLLQGSLVPQANDIRDVGRVVEAVAMGKNGDVALGAHIGKNDRQGRYYRLAAEDIGLLAPVQAGVSAVTTMGALFAAERDPARKRQMLVDGVMSNPVVRGVLQDVKSAGATGRSLLEIAMWVETNTTLTGDTPRRRASTVARWLENLGLILKQDGRYVLNPAHFPVTAVAPEEPDPHTPLPTTPPALVPFGGVAPLPTKAVPAGVVQRWVDQAKLERANQKHEQLVRKVAELATDAGYECRRNLFVDLFAAKASDANLFEMKSNHPANTVAQVRKAVAQLYEYEYQQSLQGSRLVLVLESEPAGDSAWTVGYLVKARNIFPVWESGDVFDGPHESRAAFPWMT